MHQQDLAASLEALKAALERHDIRFAVIGAIAMRQRGYARYTEDIDIVTTPEGLDRIHEHLIGRGYVPRAAGLRKKLRDTVHKVNLDVIQAGEHAGAAGSPVVYPHPESPAFEVGDDAIRYATLPALISFKMASGIWGKRPQDLADVHQLIKANGLDEAFVGKLPAELHARFCALVAATRDELDIE